MQLTLDPTLAKYLILVVIQFVSLFAAVIWVAHKKRERLQYSILTVYLLGAAMILALIEVQFD